jgi:hypothetical protein
VPDNTIAESQTKNEDLIEVVIALMRVVLTSVVDQRHALQEGTEAGGRPLLAMSTLETMARLRPVVMHCARLARHSTPTRAARELDGIGTQLAEELQRLEEFVRIPKPE